jgi:hypothetical protein
MHGSLTVNATNVIDAICAKANLSSTYSKSEVYANSETYITSETYARHETYTRNEIKVLVQTQWATDCPLQSGINLITGKQVMGLNPTSSPFWIAGK